MISLLVLPIFFLLNNCGSAGGGSSGSSGGAIVQVQMKISSGGLTVGANKFKFDSLDSVATNHKISNPFAKLFLPAANASTTFRVSPNKAKLRITKFNFAPIETSVDTSTESAFNLNQVCEVDYDSASPNQTFTCTIELQAGLHYKTIDFNVAPNVDIYINDSTNNIYTTSSGVTTSNPGAGLGYFTANFNNNNTNFHAELPFTLDTSALATTLSKITTLDGCSNTIKVKLILSNGTVLSDTNYTPGSVCGIAGTSSSTVNIGTQELNVVVDMIHGVQVDNTGGPMAINTSVPWWTIVGSVGTGLSVKHFASTASGLTAATYLFPPGAVGINELKIAYVNGVAVAVHTVPNGFNTTTFCKEDFDTPNNSLGGGYVGSDSNGAAWAVGPYTVGTGMTSYTGEFYMNTLTNVFYCKVIGSDPNPAPGQNLDTFSPNMPVPDGTWKSQNMNRIDL